MREEETKAQWLRNRRRRGPTAELGRVLRSNGTHEMSASFRPARHSREHLDAVLHAARGVLAGGPTQAKPSQPVVKAKINYRVQGFPQGLPICPKRCGQSGKNAGELARDLFDHGAKNPRLGDF